MSLKKVIIILFLFPICVYAQFTSQKNNELDSLKRIINSSKHDTIIISALLRLGYEYEQVVPDSALILYHKALDVATKNNNARLMATCNNYLGIVYLYERKYRTAIHYYSKALELFEENRDKKRSANCFGNIGFAHSLLGDFDKALHFYYLQLDIAKKLDDKVGLVYCYNGIAMVYNDQGNYYDAVEYYQKSLAIAEELNNKAGQAHCYMGIGIVYSDQGIYNQAMKYYQKALALNEEIGDKRGVSNCLNNLGVVCKKQGNYAEAIKYYQQSLEMNKEQGDSKGMSGSFINIGNVYKNQGNLTEAGKYFNKALSIYAETSDKNGLAISYANLAGLHFDISEKINNNEQTEAEIDSAIYFAKTSLKIAQEISAKPRIVSANHYLARGNWALGRMENAMHCFYELMDLDYENINMNFSFLSEKEKEDFFILIKEHFWQFNSFALSYIEEKPTIAETVYNNTLRNKGLLLKSSNAMRVAVQSSNDSLLITKYDEWINLKKQIANKYSKGLETAELEIIANTIEANLVKNSNEISDFKKMQNVSWRDVQGSLSEGELAIEFLHFPLYNPDSGLAKFTKSIQYIALIIGPKYNQPRIIPLFEEKDLVKIISKKGGNNYTDINDIYGKNSDVKIKLYDLFWKPIEHCLPGVKKIYLSPSGLLHKVSFSAIAKQKNIYLSDLYSIEIMSSTGILIRNKSEFVSDNIKNVSLFGGINYNTDSTKKEIWKYLEGTKIEIENIEKVFEKDNIKTKAYYGNEASEERLKQVASTSNVLHVATHGFFYQEQKEENELNAEQNTEKGDVFFRGGEKDYGIRFFVNNSNPLMRSGLVLAGANDVWDNQMKINLEDGVLTAQEIANLDMRKSNLVVLSACETGLGDIKGSEGVYGMQRAFKLAGVKYIIMSLWQVPDKETVEFMEFFYSKFIKLKDIKKSFRETQKLMRNKYDPYFWGAFVLIE